MSKRLEQYTKAELVQKLKHSEARVSRLNMDISALMSNLSIENSRADDAVEDLDKEHIRCMAWRDLAVAQAAVIKVGTEGE